MTPPKWLTLIGGILLTFGVLMALISTHYTERVMGNARKGVAVLAPDEDSPEWKEKLRMLWWADFWFYSGLFLTAIGGILQTLGGILPLTDSDSASSALGIVVTRGAEGWQFLAFIFGALLVLVYGLLDELSDQWWRSRVTLKIGSFLLVGYLTLVNVWFRNLLIGLLHWFTRETH